MPGVDNLDIATKTDVRSTFNTGLCCWTWIQSCDTSTRWINPRSSTQRKEDLSRDWIYSAVVEKCMLKTWFRVFELPGEGGKFFHIYLLNYMNFTECRDFAVENYRIHRRHRGNCWDVVSLSCSLRGIIVIFGKELNFVCGRRCFKIFKQTSKRASRKYSTETDLKLNRCL